MIYSGNSALTAAIVKPRPKRELGASRLFEFPGEGTGIGLTTLDAVAYQNHSGRNVTVAQGFRRLAHCRGQGRLATEGGARPLGLTFWQTFGGGVMLLAVCTVRRKWPIINRRFLLFYLVVGSFGSVIPGTLFFYAAPHVPAGILAITVATVPLLTYGASWLFRIDRFSVKRVSGIVAGLMAIVLLVAPDTSLPEPAMAGWVLMVLKSSGAVFASQAGYVVTLAGVLWGVIIFGETHSGWVWLAMCLIMIGLALVTPRELNSAQREPDKHVVKEVNRPL